jgi:hypothetical protein
LEKKGGLYILNGQIEGNEEQKRERKEKKKKKKGKGEGRRRAERENQQDQQNQPRRSAYQHWRTRGVAS